MVQENEETLEGAAGEVLSRLEAWRRTRKSGQRLPEDLWREAGALARRFGINRASHALGLNYIKVRDHAGQGAGLVHQPRAARAAVVKPALPVSPAGIRETERHFVELSMDPGARVRAPGEPAAFPEEAGAGPVVEVTSRDGARMVMRWPCGSTVDAGAMVASFLGRS